MQALPSKMLKTNMFWSRGPEHDRQPNKTLQQVAHLICFTFKVWIWKGVM